MLFLDEGSIIAIMTIMIVTGMLKKIKELKPNWKWIPKGFWLSLIVGGIVLYICQKLNLIKSLTESLWQYLGSWIIITGLAGYGYIAGNKLLIFVKALVSKNHTEIEQSQLEIEQHKNKIKILEKRIEDCSIEDCECKSNRGIFNND